MKKVLITGSNGLLGQKIVLNYSSSPDWEIIGTGLGPNRITSTKDFTYVTMDITNRKNVLEVLAEYSPDVVINTAAMTNVDVCEDDPMGCDELNVEAVKYLVEGSEKIGAHLIHLSTDFIFDGEDGPYSEDDRPNPLSYYGKSKWLSEGVVRKAQCPWSIVRTVLVIGIAEGMSRSNIILWAKGALSKGQEISVVNDQFRTPTLAEDLADGCMLIAEKGETGIFNISGKDFLSILEIVHLIADHFSFDKSLIAEVSSKTLNQRAKRPPVTGFVLDKAIDVLGYSPRSFVESIQIIDKQSEDQKKV